MIQNTTFKNYNSLYSLEESVVLTVSLCVIITASFIGSVIMLIVLYKNDKMWTSSNMLIGNLAAASLGATVSVMPFSLFTVAKHKWIFKEGHICKLTGSCGSLFLLATIFTHTMISVDKYYAVVRPMSRVMTVKKTCILICGIWALASVMSIVPLIGFSGFEYNPKTLICGVKYPQNTSDKLYLLVLALVGFILPFMIMGYVYTRVQRAIKQHAVRLLAHAVISFDVLKLQKKLVLTVFSSLLCFLLCWSPFCALTIIASVSSTSDDIPRGLGVAAYWTGYLNSALNPIIICSMSNRFKQGFIEIFKGLVMLLVCGFLRTNEDDKTRTYTSTTNILATSSWFSKKGNVKKAMPQRCTTLPNNSRVEHSGMSAKFLKRSNSLPSTATREHGHGEIVKNTYVQLRMHPISENNSDTESLNQRTPINSPNAHESLIDDTYMAHASNTLCNAETKSKDNYSFCNGSPCPTGFSEEARDSRTHKKPFSTANKDVFKPELISIQTEEMCV